MARIDRRDHDTLYDLLTTRANAVGQSPFLWFEGEQVSYSQTLANSTRIAQSLTSLGCKPGDPIYLMLENSPTYLFSWFGIALAGLVEVPINIEYRSQILRQVLANVEGKVLFCEDYLLGIVDEVIGDGTSAIDVVICVRSRDLPEGANEKAAAGGYRLLAWGEFMGASSVSGADLRRRASVDLACIMFTSGTTGVSKGVMVSERHMVMQGREVTEAFGLDSTDAMFTCLPLFHGNAQMSTVMAALVAGAQVALSRRFSASRFWDEVVASGATQVNFLGAMLHILLAQPVRDIERQHRVRIANASPAPVEAMFPFERRFGIHILESYGTTETKRILTNRHYLRRPGSMGFPTASSIVEIQDEDGWRVPPGVIGEIVFRPSEPGILTSGYFKRPEATLEVLRDGWWHTGDLGRCDSDGFFYFEGRKKDSLRRRGENVSAFEVERALLSHPLISQAAVVAVPSAVTEDDILAAVILAKGAELPYEDIFAYADANLPYFMVPRFFVSVDELPLTPGGKVRKPGLAENVMATGLVWDSEKAGLRPSRSRDRKIP